VINVRSTKLSHLTLAIPTHGHRTSHARFLMSDWDAAGILAAQAIRIIRQMKPQQGESLYLLIDDTRIKKRGKKRDGISKIWDPKSHCFVHGHMVVSAAIQSCGVTIPWAIALWLPRAYAGAPESLRRGSRELTPGSPIEN